MQTVSRLLLQRFWVKICFQTAGESNHVHDIAKGHQIISTGHNLVKTEVDFILPGSLLMMRAFGMNAHLLQIKADFPSDILTLIQWRNITIAGLIIGNRCRLSVFISLKQVKLAFRACHNLHSLPAYLLHHTFQQRACIQSICTPIRITYLTIHSDNTPNLRTPWKNGQCGDIRKQKQIGGMLLCKL